MARDSGKTVHSNTARRHRLRHVVRKVIFAGLAMLILLGVGVVLLGPTISGAAAPMLVNSLMRDRLAGKLTISDVHLSWTGPQQIGAFELRDANGAVVASGALDANTNLLSAIRGSRDLGDIALRGHIDLPGALDALGQPTGKSHSAGGNPVAPSSAGAISLPPALKANITLDGVTIVFASDNDHGDDAAVGLKDITGTINFAVGKQITVSLAASSMAGADSVNLDATIDGLTDISGALTTSAARIDVNLNGTMTPEQLEHIALSLG